MMLARYNKETNESKHKIRFEIDATAFGDRMARYAFEFLNGRKIPPEVVASATYVQGESFPEAS